MIINIWKIHGTKLLNSSGNMAKRARYLQNACKHQLGSRVTKKELEVEKGRNTKYNGGVKHGGVKQTQQVKIPIVEATAPINIPIVGATASIEVPIVGATAPIEAIVEAAPINIPIVGATASIEIPIVKATAPINTLIVEATASIEAIVEATVPITGSWEQPLQSDPGM